MYVVVNDIPEGRHIQLFTSRRAILANREITIDGDTKILQFPAVLATNEAALLDAINIKLGMVGN